MDAATEGNLKCLEVLISYGADTTMRDKVCINICNTLHFNIF
jgi:hypothetical protein